MTTIEQYLDGLPPYADGREQGRMEYALRAVAHLHAPTRFARNSHMEEPHCAECELDEQLLPWPCATMQVIHAALGIDGKDEHDSPE